MNTEHGDYMLHGWIKLHRQLLDHWSASEPEMLATWIRLLLEANHQDAKKVINGTLVDIKRGQLLFGYNAFSTKSGVTKKKLERYMKLFETEGMLERQRGSKYSLITITCYDHYQNEGGRGEAEEKQKGSTGEHRKNVKNDNNEKKPKDVRPSDEADQEKVIEIWNSLGCERHRGITQKAAKAIDKTYAHFCKGRSKENPAPDVTTWLSAYLANGFRNWMTDHHRKMDDGKWAADLEFAVRLDTYEKVKNTVTR